jgi:serine phosphatase RsbU (regulator of sigma subunit)
MEQNEKEHILSVLKDSIKKEINSLHYYRNKAADPKLPQSVKGLINRLADEESIHSRELVKELSAFSKYWNNYTENDIHNAEIPKKPKEIHFSLSNKLSGSAVCFPGKFLGGDNIITHSINDTKTLIILYDVMGHSMHTTEINAYVNTTIHKYIENAVNSKMEERLLTPKGLTNHINKKIYITYEDEGIFITLFICVIDTEKNKIAVTCAGNEPAVIKNKNTITSLTETQLITGIDPKRIYEESIIDFPVNSVIFIFSDGIVELKNKDKQMLGRNHIETCIEKMQYQNPYQALSHIFTYLHDFADNNSANDEISLIVIENTGTVQNA